MENCFHYNLPYRINTVRIQYAKTIIKAEYILRSSEEEMFLLKNFGGGKIRKMIFLPTRLWALRIKRGRKRSLI